MSSVTKVSTGWRARWRTPDGKSRSKTFARKIDAEKHLTGTDHAKLTGAYVDPGAGRITFRTYGEQWRAVQVHRPSTAVQLETNLRRHVYPTLGERPIGAIRPSEGAQPRRGPRAEHRRARLPVRGRHLPGRGR